MRQLLTESVMLSLAGGIVGLAAGYAGIRAILSISPGNIPRIGLRGTSVGLDWRVLGFTLVLSLVTGILFGLVPALQSSRADLNSSLKESNSRSGTGLHHNRTRALLVTTEMALALVLLVGAALLIRTFLAVRQVNPGFDARNVLTMRMSLTGPQFEKPAGVTQLFLDGVRRIRALPGVEVAASTCCVPLEGGFGLPFQIPGRPEGPTSKGGAGWTMVSAGYFETFKIPVLRGRTFTEQDDGGPPVVIINQKLAKQFWPKGDPLSDRIIIGRGVGPAFQGEPPRQIIGVVGDVRDGALNRDPRPNVYVLPAQIIQGGERTGVADNPLGLGGPNSGATLVVEFRYTEGAARGQRRTAGRAHPHDGTNHIAIDGRRELQHAGVDDFRLRRARAGRDRDLRAHGVLGSAANPGDWHPAGNGRGIEQGSEHGGVPGAAARISGSRRRARRGIRANEAHRKPVIRSQGFGSHGIFGGPSGAHRRRAGSGMVAGAARESGRSDPRTTLRIGCGWAILKTRRFPILTKGSHCT